MGYRVSQAERRENAFQVCWEGLKVLDYIPCSRSVGDREEMEAKAGEIARGKKNKSENLQARSRHLGFVIFY